MSPMPASIRRICWEPVIELPQEEIESLIANNRAQIYDYEAWISYLKQLRIFDSCKGCEYLNFQAYYVGS